mmetsp:Transcript_62917/g.169816  ORF Transcript_62917/g.169816 Transcript_62917/m.169816 type:complete len:367 (+) Transcript_62917:3-1103(+)
MAAVSYEAPEHLPDLPALAAAVGRLVAIADEAARADAVSTVFRLLHGVLSAPDDERKRRVRKANPAFHQKLGRHAAGVELLGAVGFEECDDTDAADAEAGVGALLCMKTAFPARLTDAHHALAAAARGAGLPVPPLPAGGFNPYASSQQKSDASKVLAASIGYKAEVQRIREEVKERERSLREAVDSAPPVELRPSAFWHSAGRRLEEVIQEAADAEAKVADVRGTDAALLRERVASVKAAIQGNERFESASKRKLAELSRAKTYPACVLRVICPDKSVLQAHFRSAATGKQVQACLDPLLATGVRAAGWYLYQSPPLRRLALEETLEKAGVGAGANYYLGFEGPRPAPPFLEPGLAAALGPRPER